MLAPTSVLVRSVRRLSHVRVPREKNVEKGEVEACKAMADLMSLLQMHPRCTGEGSSLRLGTEESGGGGACSCESRGSHRLMRVEGTMTGSHLRKCSLCQPTPE